MKWMGQDINELSDSELRNASDKVSHIRRNYESKRASASEKQLKLMPQGPSQNFLDLETEIQNEVSKRSVSVRNTELSEEDLNVYRR